MGNGTRLLSNVDLHPDMFYCGSAKRSIIILLDSYRNIYTDRTFTVKLRQRFRLGKVIKRF